MSKELQIINDQINLLQGKQQSDELTFDDIRQLDLLIKNKLLLKQANPDEEDDQVDSTTFSKDDLMKELHVIKNS